MTAHPQEVLRDNPGMSRHVTVLYGILGHLSSDLHVLSRCNIMAIIQRPLKGSRISSFYPVKSLPPLSALDSAFQLQEYISLLIRLDVHDVETIVSIPERQHGLERESSDGSNGEEKDEEKEGKDVTVDESCWVYEQLRCVVPLTYCSLDITLLWITRRLAQDLTHPLITTLQQECTRSTCPEMKAGEWLYLCVAHGNESAMEVRPTLSRSQV